MLKKVVLITGTLGTIMALAAVGCSGSSSDLVGGADSGSEEGDGSIGFGKDAGSKDGGDKIDGSVIVTDGGIVKKDGGGIVNTVDSGTVTNPVDAGTVATLDAGRPAADSGVDAGGGVTLADGGTLACFNASTADYDTSTGPATHQNKCTSTQITTFDTTCFGSGGTSAGCNALLSADPDCGACLFGSGTAGAAPVVLPIGANDEVNSAGCYAAISATATADCKLRYENVNYCTQTACASCSDNTTAGECFDYSETDPGSVCATNFGLDTTCVDSVEGSLTIVDATNECGYNASTFDTAFVAVATTFCGP